MPTTEKTLRDLRESLHKAYISAAKARDNARTVMNGYNPVEAARLAGKVEGLGAARKLVEMLCQ